VCKIAATKFPINDHLRGFLWRQNQQPILNRVHNKEKITPVVTCGCDARSFESAWDVE